jgi:selenide,water dikinase
MRELVLVGAGHAHLLVLEAFAARPPEGVRVTLVSDAPVARYSGMLPAVVAGELAPHALEIALAPLAARAGARLVTSAATRVDPRERRIALAGGDSLRYDVASLDVGSALAGLELPGVAEQALPTRPLGAFLERLAQSLPRAAATPLRCALVGGGAGGAELAFALAARLAREGRHGRVTIVERSPRLLPERAPRVGRRLAALARERGIALRLGVRVEAAEPGRLLLAGGEALPFDLLLWAAGAAAPRLLLDSPLPRDERGFVRVAATLAVEGCPGLFAAGDAASLPAAGVPKSGVHAVREGPLLARNLRAALAGRPLRRYRPQRDFLVLLNLGDGRALATKWGLAVSGAWVRRWKAHLDAGFVGRFAAAGSASAAD